MEEKQDSAFSGKREAKDKDAEIWRLKKALAARQGQFSISGRDKKNPYIKKIRVVSTIEYSLSDCMTDQALFYD